MSKPAATKAAKPRVSSRKEIEERRKRGYVVPGPSGIRYRVRKPNLMRIALDGGLPPSLLKAAARGESGGLEALAEAKLSAKDRERLHAYQRKIVLATLAAFESGEEIREKDLGTGAQGRRSRIARTVGGCPAGRLSPASVSGEACGIAQGELSAGDRGERRGGQASEWVPPWSERRGPGGAPRSWGPGTRTVGTSGSLV